MRKTIMIGDKYKSLMEYYSERFDKEEFNIFITQLLIAYKKMKDKDIDILIFTELIEKYDINIYDLISLVTKNSNFNDAVSDMDGIIVNPSNNVKRQEINVVNKEKRSINEEIKTEGKGCSVEKTVNQNSELISDKKQIEISGKEDEELIESKKNVSSENPDNKIDSPIYQVSNKNDDCPILKIGINLAG